MNKNTKKFFLGFLIAVVGLVAVSTLYVGRDVLAQTVGTDELGLNEVNNAIGLPSSDIRIIIARIIRAALGLLGIVAVGLIIYGGYLWMTAGGNDEQVGKAKKVLINSVLGLVIIFSAYAITQFIFNRLVGATTDIPAHCSDGIQNEGETATDCGGACPACSTGGCPTCGWNNANVLYVDRLPPSGPACVRNVKPVVIFTQAVNLESVKSNLQIVLKSDPNTIAPGNWQYGRNKNIVIFEPSGDCGDSGADDCLNSSTEYTLRFLNNGTNIVADSNPDLRLACNMTCNNARGCCGNVNFATGDSVDRLPPTVVISRPQAANPLNNEQNTDVQVSYTDDNGMQSVTVYADGVNLGTQTVSNCTKQGQINLSWPTIGIPLGEHRLSAVGYDWAGGNDDDEQRVRFYPGHCFNNSRDQDETGLDCGGSCGACGNDYCDNNEECQSGYCDLTSHKCIDKMRITDFSPSGGAPGTYVSIDGFFFGQNGGKVYFAKKDNPNVDTASDWIEAKLVECGSSFDAWTPWQIVVEVPESAVDGPIKVETLPTLGADNKTYIFTDVTNDTWGNRLPNFDVNNDKLPGLCGLNPNNSKPGEQVDLTGKNLGTLSNPNEDYVQFGSLKAVVLPDNWASSEINNARVPGLSAGAVGVKVVVNNKSSNSLRFTVNEGLSADWPVINEISPSVEIARGGYLTIRGNNFGTSRGRVYFRPANGGETIEGDQSSFPSGCVNTWTNTEIIVKFPLDGGTEDSYYYIQVNNTSNSQEKISLIDARFKLQLKGHAPPPGICHITPTAGPSRFPEAAPKIKIVGEYFLKGVNPGEESVVDALFTGPASSRVGTHQLDGAKFSLTNDRLIETFPPPNVQSGPVSVKRSTQVSNSVNYFVQSCNNDDNCPGDEKCCLAGTQSGFCVAQAELCQGETRAGGYIWRFSNKEIVQSPRVVENCELNPPGLPSPSPSLMWNQLSQGDHNQVCRTSVVSVSISNLGANVASLTPNNVVVQECDMALAGNVCQNPQNVPVVDQNNSAVSYSLISGSTVNERVLQLHPAATYASSTGKWKSNTWYRVALKDSISTVRSVGSAGNLRNITVNLAKDNPCSDVEGSAYCFVFKTGTDDCRINAVAVTPKTHWTNILEAPMRLHTLSGIYPLSYFATPLSNQECVAMNSSGINWDWRSQRTIYADIYNKVSGNREQKVSALRNTVAIGLSNPQDALRIVAQTTTTLPNGQTRTISNASSNSGILTIDTSRPEVVDYWPKCLEACTNANVAVKFNTTMSNYNLTNNPPTSVRLQKCLDENCTILGPNLAGTSVYLDSASNYTVLNIANAVAGANDLATNTLYLVKISANVSGNASTLQTELMNRSILWSALSWGNPESRGKPYAKEFSFRFRTKAETCAVDRIEVEPKRYVARDINEKTIFTSEAYSKPDNCSVNGQRLNSWDSGWRWASSNDRVATVTSTFTRGRNPNCTASCIRKGSDVLATPNVVALPVCGNGIIEAGEDCDLPNKTGNCGLDCLFINKINTGSNASPSAVSTSTSICGNGMVGIGEDCDLGIAPDYTSTTTSAGCNERCLHTGTRLSKKWCQDRLAAGRGGFTLEEFQNACVNAYSQCGDKIASPDEDPSCDDATSGWNSTLCDERCLIKTNARTECLANSEGCNDFGQHVGSSLNYSTPSFCGDDRVGLGEDPSCEDNFLLGRSGFASPFNLNPWALVSGVGESNPLPGSMPPSQVAVITAETKEIPKTASGRTVGGQGNFEIQCGYSNDADCPLPNQGVANNTCCYARPVKLSTYPANGRTNVCANTYLEAKFNDRIDQNTLSGNLIIARGTTSSTCPSSTVDVTDMVYIAERRTTVLPWYKAWWFKVSNFVFSVFSNEVQAFPHQMNRWCAGDDLGGAEVIVTDMTSSTSSVVVKMKQALAYDSDYTIILKDGIRNERGVSIGKSGTYYHQWKFITGSQICEIDSVEVRPDTSYLSRVGSTTTLFAYAGSSSNQLIQSVRGYAWEYLWGPKNNEIVTLTSTTMDRNIITALNRNGEVDVVATAKITENEYSAQSGEVASDEGRAIVFLCENPWPPKDLTLGGPTYSPFPFDDRSGNEDHFNLASTTFDGTDLAGPYFNFSTYYCADNGANGTVDDLPYLRPVKVPVSGRCRYGETGCNTDADCPEVEARLENNCLNNVLKKFILTTDKNSDAIGVQVFKNTEHLTPEQWFKADKELGGQGFTGNLNKIKIDGYDAVTDGNNVYVDALNYDNPTSAGGNIYTNIYLFSINSDAREESRKVFSQLLNNLRFNINISPNKRFCGTSLNSVNYDKPCISDLDCDPGQICANQVDKLKRNYERLRDLSDLELGLRSYAAKNGGKSPDMKAGSLLSGQTISTWDSWSALSNAIGFAAPTDPINRLGKAGTCSTDFGRHCTVDSQCPTGQTCIIHDPLTGWSTEGRRFSFSCSTSSLAYRYLFTSSTASYTVRTKFENINFASWDANLNRLLDEFTVSSTLFIHDPSGICMGAQEIATQQAGRCGDGVTNYNLNEECDPPGSTARENNCPVANEYREKRCSSSCKWTYPDPKCKTEELCGNGRVDAGEMCDEGKELNGKPGHCMGDCKSRNLTCGNGRVDEWNDEYCDWAIGLDLSKFTGWCTGGLNAGIPCSNDSQCKSGWSPTPVDGRCQGLKYSLTGQSASCNWDCNSFGPYCGDGIVQSEYGEECEESQACTINNVLGSRKCTQCKMVSEDQNVWLKFDNLKKILTTTYQLINSGNLSITNITCSSNQSSTKTCPGTTTTARFGNAFAFDGSKDIIEINNFNHGNNFTISFWMNPSVSQTGEKALLVKGDPSSAAGGMYVGLSGGNTTGYTIKMQIGNSSSYDYYYGPNDKRIKINEWNLLSFSLNQDKKLIVYLNGNKIGEKTMTAASPNVAQKMQIGRTTTMSSQGVEALSGLIIDDFRYFNRELTDTENLGLYQNFWFCKAGASSSSNGPSIPTAVCGDGKVDEQTEFCDNGTQNGVVCTASYGQPCSYCSNDCSRMVDVRPTEYCGNSKIDPGSSEKCEVKDNLIYAFERNYGGSTESSLNSEVLGYKVKTCKQTNILQRGDKSCSTDCKSIASSCVTCGVSTSETAREIRGEIVNVLTPDNNFTGYGQMYLDTTALEAYWRRISGSSLFTFNSNKTGPTNASTTVKLETNEICSNSEDGYKILFNDDRTNVFPFVARLNSDPWSYDFLLSPMISDSNHVRLVVSWIGDSDYDIGVLIRPGDSPLTDADREWDRPYSDPPFLGAWYHGEKKTANKTNVKSITVSTIDLHDAKARFYVKSREGGIQNLRSDLLKVEVYIPGNDRNTGHFGKPYQTFYLNEAKNSLNQDAEYWQVLNIEDGILLPVPGSGRLQTINAIKTGLEEFSL